MSLPKESIVLTRAPWSFSLCVAFFLSGFCGLIYQMVWIRKFSLVFGSTVFAMSAVIAVFFGGLAIGSRLFGNVSTTARNPVRQYAILEILIGIYALVFPWILELGETVYAYLYPLVSGNFVFLLIIRVFVSFVVLFLPTVLMGGTLPLLTRHFARKLSSAGGQAGLIYGLNTVGAAMGSFLTGYLFLQTLGVGKTNLLAGLINIVVALAALAISRQTTLTHAPQVKDKNRTVPEIINVRRQGSMVIPMTMVCFGISGFVSMAYEVMWLRYSLFSFRDTSHLYTGIIAVFILGIGIGSLVCRWIVNKVSSPLILFGFLQLGIGLSTVLAVYLPIPWFQTIYEAGDRSNSDILLHLFMLLSIPAVLMGATFPVVTKIITTELHTVGKQVGRAYALNTAGSICGSLAAGFFLFPVMGLQATLYLLFGLNMTMAAVLIAAENLPGRRFIAAIPVLLCVLFPVSLVYGLDSQLPELIVHKISNKEELLEISEGITGTTWATKSRYSEIALIENSVVISRGDSGSFLTHGYIPLLLAPEIPQSVLGLCFGGGLSYYAGRLFPEISRFDFVDISKKNMDIGIRHFPQNKGLKDDPRARFIIDDAYNYIKYTDNTYNVILMEPTPPIFGFRNAALYTNEFYELARRRLTEDGYFTQVLPLKDMSYLESMSVMKTFSSVFDHCLLWWNGFEPVMIGSSQKFRLDTRKIAERLKRPLIQNSLKEISKAVGYNYSGKFLSGLLLTTGDFRKVAAVGTVYTNDFNGLEYSTGYEGNFDSVLRIHEHLSPWDKTKKIITGIELDDYTQPLTERREYLMRELYNMFRRVI